jgi:hypothetical protein
MHFLLSGNRTALPEPNLPELLFLRQEEEVSQLDLTLSDQRFCLENETPQFLLPKQMTMKLHQHNMSMDKNPTVEPPTTSFFLKPRPTACRAFPLFNRICPDGTQSPKPLLTTTATSPNNVFHIFDDFDLPECLFFPLAEEMGSSSSPSPPPKPLLSIRYEDEGSTPDAVPFTTSLKRKYASINEPERDRQARKLFLTLSSSSSSTGPFQTPKCPRSRRVADGGSLWSPPPLHRVAHSSADRLVEVGDHVNLPFLPSSL